MYPKSAVTHYKLGVIYVQKGDRKTAEKYLQQAMSIDPNFDLPYYELAKLTYQYNGAKKALPMANELVKKFTGKAEYVDFQRKVEQEVQSGQIQNNSDIKPE